MSGMSWGVRRREELGAMQGEGGVGSGDGRLLWHTCSDVLTDSREVLGTKGTGGGEVLGTEGALG